MRVEPGAERERGKASVDSFGDKLGGRALLIRTGGTAGRGVRLRPGMAFAIEPMTTLGNPKLVILDEDWTVVTVDGSSTAQFEHTVLATTNGVEVLTGLDTALEPTQR